MRCPVRQEYEANAASRPIPFALSSLVDLEPRILPNVGPVDRGQAGDLEEDLETLESHPAGCQCTPCWRATLRMSNRPELAATVP